MPTGRHLPVRCCCWLRCPFPVCGILILTALALTAALPAQVKQPNDIVRFRLRDKYLILVQTTVDGAGPFPFLLDTGSTHTVIDPGLAQQLRTPVIGETSLVTVSDIHNDRLVRLDKVRVGNSEVSELGAIIDKLDEVKLRAPGIRGVLGEDFLSNSTYLSTIEGEPCVLMEMFLPGNDVESRPQAVIKTCRPQTAFSSRRRSWMQAEARYSCSWTPEPSCLNCSRFVMTQSLPSPGPAPWHSLAGQMGHLSIRTLRYGSAPRL